MTFFSEIWRERKTFLEHWLPIDKAGWKAVDLREAWDDDAKEEYNGVTTPR